MARVTVGGRTLSQLGVRSLIGGSAVFGLLRVRRRDTTTSKKARISGFATPAFAGCAFVEGERTLVKVRYRACQHHAARCTASYRRTPPHPSLRLQLWLEPGPQHYKGERRAADKCSRTHLRPLREARRPPAPCSSLAGNPLHGTRVPSLRR
jgi:hypothetical protein